MSNNAQDNEKVTYAGEEIEHTLTVEPVPATLAHDGGFVLDTKGLDAGVQQGWTCRLHPTSRFAPLDSHALVLDMLDNPDSSTH